MPLPLRALAPAPPKQVSPEPHRSTSFFDLPPELRIEIYRLVLENVTIKILPANTSEQPSPHALACTSRQIRSEILPIMHSDCPIQAYVTDFNFDGILAWMNRIPPNQQSNLCKNDRLRIWLHVTEAPGNFGGSLRKWLQVRADPHRSQPRWQYDGNLRRGKVMTDMWRRLGRMTEQGKREELLTMLRSIRA